MNWGNNQQIINNAVRQLLLVLLLLLTCSASKFNWSWMVPGGEVTLDKTSITSSKFCALTFDDGPDKRYTAEIGRILERHDARGTFFVLGKEVAANPDVLAELVAGGHEIENHSWSHPDFTRLSKANAEKELTRTADELAKLGVTSNWFRPPYGSYNRAAVSTAAGQGLKTILWSVDPRDWSTPGVEVIVNRVLKGAHPGAVILLHSTNPQTVAALPWIVDGLRDDGYQLVTISEWEQLVSGGALPTQPKAVPLVDPPSGAQSLPEMVNDYRGYGAGGVKVFSNFNGTDNLKRALARGSTDGQFNFSYEKVQLAQMASETQEPDQDIFGAMLEAVAAIADADMVSEPAAAAPSTFVLWEALEQANDWQFQQDLTRDSLLAADGEDGVPRFYLVRPAAGSWSGSEAMLRLLMAGRFSGIAVAADFGSTADVTNLPAPATHVQMAQLPEDSVVNLSRQDTGAILRAIAAGHGNLFVTVNPADLTSYRSDGDIHHIQFMAEFLLLRLATEGLASLAVSDDLSAVFPEYIAWVAFGDGEQSVLALRGQPVQATVPVPEQFLGGYITRLSAAGTCETMPVTSSEITVGDDLLIISTAPLTVD